MAVQGQEGNLAAVLVLLARWRRCCCCQALVLYVNNQARTDGDVECPTCVAVREDLTRRLRYVKLASRVRVRLRSLFTTANDNGEART